MAAPTPPSGVTQAELDLLFQQIRTAGETHKQAWMKSRVPLEYIPHWEYAQSNPGKTATAITAAAVINANALVTFLLLCNTPGTGTITLNDCKTVPAANSGNQIFSMGAAEFTAGKSVELTISCSQGLVCSAFPTGGNYTIVYGLAAPG